MHAGLLDSLAARRTLSPSAPSDAASPAAPSRFDPAWLGASTGLLAVCDAAGHLRWCNAAFEACFPANASTVGPGSLFDRLQLTAPDDDALRAALLVPTPASLQGQARQRSDDGGHAMVLRPFSINALVLAPDQRLVQVEPLRPEQADDPVASARAHLAEAIELAGVVIWQRDLEAGTVRFNRQGALLFGFDPQVDLFPMESWRERIHPGDAQRFFKVPRRAGRQAQKETRFRLPDGQWGLLMATVVSQQDTQGRSQSLIGVALDVTERRRTEIALRQANESAALAARGVGLAIWSMDVGTGEVVWDEQMWRLRRLPPQDEAPDSTAILQMVHPDDRAEAERRLRSAPDLLAQTQAEFRILWPDGTVRWLASRSAPVLDEHGRVLRRVGVNWDITDAREAEIVRREREGALRESRAKSEFLARMSHELRTPLNAIIGFSQLLLSQERGDDTATAARRHRLDHIRGAGQQLLGLINDVLDLSGLEGSGPLLASEPVALEPMLVEVIAALGPLATEGGVRVQTGAIAAAPLADGGRLRQVIRVLIARAIRRTPANGIVHLSARSGDGRVHLAIADAGPIVTAEELGDVFEPFSEAQATAVVEASHPAAGHAADTPAVPAAGHPAFAPGSALGLTMARAVIERMSGKLVARAQAGGGTVFEIDLPDAAPRVVDESPGQPLLRAPGTTVLYIEDNPVNALIVRELLARRSDLMLHIATTGAEGVALAQQLKPRLILLDMQLPDFDGFEVLRRLRASPSVEATQVIALSANAMPHDIDRALAAGMSAYWTKPLDFSAFMQSLDAMFGRVPEA